jgi:hypothetical protein
MASFRKPKGTYVRPTGDWFSANLCSGAWYDDTAGAATYLWIGLYNDDNLGRSLYILGISAAMDGANVMAGVVVKGTLGSQVAACVNVNPNTGAPPGKIYSRRTGPAAPPSVGQAVPAGMAFLIGTSFGSPQYTPPFPICILPQGYSCFVVSDFQTIDGGASFWYVPLNGD